MKLLRTFFLLVASAVVVHPSLAQDSVAADTTGVPFLWERPLPCVVTSGLLLAGSSTLFFDPSISVNNFVRDNVQTWRQEQFGNSGTTIDNYLQFVPYAAVEGLSLLGVPSRHSGWPLLFRTGSSLAMVTLTTHTLKHIIGEKRPDSGARNSFPSGHTSFAFGGAELLRLEYGETSPLIPVAGYTVAVTTGFMRIYNDRHWLGDVFAGAAIGLLCADFAYWLNDKLEPLLAPKKKTPPLIQ